MLLTSMNFIDSKRLLSSEEIFFCVTFGFCVSCGGASPSEARASKMGGASESDAEANADGIYLLLFPSFSR